ncbi:peroxiredoxin [Saccharomonospora viridis]|jgi:peroxiredoxin Q/BCP|uniref:thioredoxin-dependent peroxiredoxin n=2 Tax=Saccharomonospora viridis TaxID=1852 RepID=C7MT34_SACVD|nr:peroxiredoxin [Saccharomonospora viridis]ACU96671.1 Peroxiredoxin [Saccharomonospora viridis DSM 43017]KHF42817.1 peroxiredoxin [Saccharomonospora viridis]SFO90880.1 peroxiredoxin Q/BCP [Saccharomonospora viridis]
MKQKDRAPDFTLPDDDGEPRRLSELLRSGPVVLFFYPAAMTPGCTAETCHFRDLASEFAELGAQPVGVSPDPVDRQRHFSEAHGIGFPLLSDVDGTVAAQFGVRRGFGPLRTKRHTFVIDTDRTILAVIRSEFRMSVHADKALDVLRARKGA